MTNRSKHLKTGALGESIAEKYLKNKGFIILDRNYRRRFGEIDIIASKGRVHHFVEVKTIQGHGEQNNDSLNPVENVHLMKQRRLGRTIIDYLETRRMSNIEWQFDVVAIILNPKEKTALVRFYPNIIMDLNDF